MAITSYKAVVGYYNGAGTPNITTAVTGQLSDGWIPIGSPILTDAYGQCTQMMAKTDATPVIATSAYTVVTAANPQPPDATWDAQGEPLWIDTATYLQAYTKGGAYLQSTVNLASGQVTGVLPVAKGGTGATTPLAAATNLQVFSISNNLSEIVNRTAAWLNVRPTGPLPLAGDPVGDYDAATKRWVQNLINTGTTGPTMNGVMNYGVGDFHLRDSRAYIQPYEVLSDGQLLNRADWPELWAYAQLVGTITDATWVTTPARRGKYSDGNGSTTFRVPDLNGVKKNGDESGTIVGDSIGCLFARGDGGLSSATGNVLENAAPNITGYIGGAWRAGFSTPSGAFSSSPPSAQNVSSTSGSSSYTNTNIDASRSSDSYGRDNTTEVYPNHVVGVWVIRASGGFVAANTQWSVINADATKPADGTTVNSGTVSVEYKVGTAIEAQGKVYTAATLGGKYSTHLSVKNATSGKEKDISVTEEGDLSSDRFKARLGTMMDWGETGLRTGTYSVPTQSIGTSYAFNSVLSAGQASIGGYQTTMHHGLIHANSTSFAHSAWLVASSSAQFLTRISIQPNDSNVTLAVSVGGTYNYYTLQKAAVSDANVKHDISPTTVDAAWGNLSALQFVTFVYNTDEKERVRRGVIAQQAETVDPLYVKTVTYYDNANNAVRQKQLDTTPMLLDTMHVVQTLMAKVEALEAEVAFLKSGK